MAGKKGVWLGAGLVLIAACSEDASGVDELPSDMVSDDEMQQMDDAEPAAPPPFSVRGSVEQVHVWKAPEETGLQVLDAAGEVVDSGTTDGQGSLIFRKLTPGDGYTVRVTEDPEVAVTDIRVMSVDNSLPDDSFYADQVLMPGFNYIETRDGTMLAAYVQLPGPPEDGPYPTLVNYSGYDPAKPGEPVGVPEFLCESFPVLCDSPSHPSGLIGGIMGFATVGVNMRGTGCSGGAYDYWETLQKLDGYDLIEVIARQSWVQHNKVGMAGLSYPGISQLFVAGETPPGLAAISPMSVIADTATSTLMPGGILNNGFAVSWITNVLDKAQPYGRGWEKGRVDDMGDTICEENQLLHSQLVDALDRIEQSPYYDDELVAPLDPTTFVQNINVPVFMTGQWQDEQTGPHFAALMNLFDNAPIARFSVTNGVHPDGYAFQNLVEWKIFNDLYVAQRVPELDPAIRTLGPQLAAEQFGASLQIPENRFEGYTDYETALRDYEAEPALRVVFESGASAELDVAGAPEGTFIEHFAAWPIPSTQATRWYFQPDGSLSTDMPPADGGASSFEHEAEAGARTTIVEGSSWDNEPTWVFPALQQGMAAEFLSETLADDVVMIGHGSVDLYLRSTADDADLEVNLSEVRPDGKETLVQSGWLRASHRALRDDATELRPIKTHREPDVEPLPDGEWELVRVELMPFQHIFRAGSQIRIWVDTPGDSRQEWKFDLLEYDTAPTHSVAHAAAQPSSVVLPVIPDVDVPTDLPPCLSLRGMACRDYAPLDNVPMQ